MFKKLFFLILIVSISLSACGTLEVRLYQTPTPILPTSSPTMRSSLILPIETPTATTAVFASVATATLVSDAHCNQAEFVLDVSVLDGTKFQARETFTKTWRVKNTGGCTWTPDYVLAFFTGEAMTTTHEHPLLADVLPGETINLSIEMTAPKLSGKHAGYWGLKNPSGIWLPVLRGHNNETFSVEIIVEKRSEPTPNAPSVLPRSLYYSAKDANGKHQIYRLSPDGVTNTPITSEIEGITEFDVSPVDGKLVYNIGRQLIVVDANGGNRRVLVGSVDPWLAWPRWSPDGRTIAYSNTGMYFYALETDKHIQMLDDESNNYSPRDFSPDGSKLTVSIASGGIRMGVYDIASQTVSLLAPSEPRGYRLCCSPSSWSIDSKYIYVSDWIAAGGTTGMRTPGLWRYNTDGTGIPLLPVVTSSGEYINNKSAAPYQDANGNLTYLFSPPEAGMYPPPPFSLVHSDADGISNRVVLRPETFHLTDISLWTPDGRAVIIIQNDSKSNHFLNLIVIPIDPSLPVTTLLADASTLSENSLRWGP